MESRNNINSNASDPARSIEISFQLKYVECDLAEERFENHPVVQLYLSRHFIRSRTAGGVIGIPLDEHRLGNVYSGTLKGHLSREFNGIPVTSAICINSFAIHRDDAGDPGYVNVGTTHVEMGNVLKETNADQMYDHNHNLLMRTTVINGGAQVKKGVVELKIVKVELGTGINQNNLIHSVLEAPAEQNEAVLSKYEEETIQLEQAIPDSLTGTGQIRAPFCISQAGIEHTGAAFLPIAAFAMIEVPETNAAFFENAFELVLKRRNIPRSSFGQLPPKEKARIMGLILCNAVQSFEYMGDSVEMTNRHTKAAQARRKEGTEEFSNIWTSLAGDCEDSAMGIYTTLKALQATRFDKVKDKELIEIQQIAHDYTPFLTLAVVHGQKIGDDEGRGAHMYLPLIPKHQLHAALSKTSAGRDLLKRISPATPLSPAPLVSASATDAINLDQSRPPLFCEGTGHIDPLGYDDPIYDQRRYLAQNMHSIDKFKKEIPHKERDPSPFYLSNLLGVNSDFINQGINVGGFLYGTVNSNYNPHDPEQAHEMTRGALFTDVICNADNLAMMPQPVIPKATMNIMKEANMFAPPARPLVLDKTKPMLGLDVHPLLEKFVGAVKSFNRPNDGTSRGSVDLFIRDSQLDDNVVNRMIGDASQLERIFDAKYEKEMVTNDIYMYRLQLFVN